MFKQKRQVFILLLSIISAQLKAQNLEIGLMGGGSYYYGDVVTELKYQDVRYSGFMFFRKTIDNHLSLRLNLGYVRIVGIDSIASTKFQYNRNLNFFTDIYEVSVQGEYSLVDQIAKSKSRNKGLIPYVYGGLGLCYFIPQAIIKGKVYNLAALETSGYKYSQVAIVMPIGIGVRYHLTKRLQIGIEAGLRLTSTSELDDIKGGSVYADPAKLKSDDSRLAYYRGRTSVDPDTGWGTGITGKVRGKVNYITDVYMVYGLTLSYVVGPVGKSHFLHTKGGCPRFY